MIVLDTHVWLWWASQPDKLSARAREAVEEADERGVSAISCWEVGMLAIRGRIHLDRPPGRWIAAALALEGIVPIVLEPGHALAAAELDLEAFPGDPADRMIYATARALGARMVTKDRALRSFDRDLTVW
ncbi:MAG: type II toxin-antitoxin system VapC family toxin [Solirubrobacteraceae bacterium]